MRDPRLVPSLLMLAILVGYVGGAWPVRAQADPFPFQVGEVVVFSFAGHTSRECRIEAITGVFALCGNPAARQTSIGRREPPDEWVNVTQAEWVTKPRLRR